MTVTQPFLHLARVTIGCRSPLSIGSHIRDPRYDTPIVRDANRLPAIPGSTLAGTLRHLRERDHGEDPADRLFGWTAADFQALARADANEREAAESPHVAARDEWQASRVQLSWAHVHDQEDRPVDGLLLDPADEDALENDPILRLALAVSPMTRDHVGLNHRGTADDRLKYDRSCLPPGYRFTFEMRLLSAAHDDPAWTELRDLLGSPRWRLGGGTRRGYGQVQVVRMAAASFDLREPDDLARLARLSPKLSDPLPSGVLEPWELAADLMPKATLRLEAEDFLRFGQGERQIGAAGEHGVDLLPLTTERVIWKPTAEGGERAELATGVWALLPASAIKGALRHRCRFHLMRHQRAFSDAGDEAERVAAKAEVERRLEWLFGAANDDDRGRPTGQAGRLLIDDALIEVGDGDHGVITHNSIDRFTGGVREGALYGEELLFRPSFAMELRLERAETIDDADPAPLQWAMRQAVADLRAGRLALGAGGSRGHGYCSGEIEAEDLGLRAWFEGD